LAHGNRKFKLEVLEKIWSLAKGLLTPVDISNIFLTKDITEGTAWHVTTKTGNAEL
jgi:hypothetical protein